MKKPLPCPECASKNVSDVLISTRPYCRDCGFWAPVDWGTREESLERWNQASVARWGHIPRIPKWGLDLQKRVADLEAKIKHISIQKMDTSGEDN